MHAVGLRALATLCLIWLAACQPLPQPFRSQPGERPPATLLRDGPGLVIEALPGIPAPLDAELAEAVASALRDREIIAFSALATQVRINRATYRLRSAGATQPTAGDQIDIGVRWRLEAADGTIIGEVEQVDRTSRSKPDLKTIAAKTAESLLPFLRDPLALEPEPGQIQKAGIVIPTLLGQPPGDGATSLARAMEAVLKLRGLNATTDPSLFLSDAIKVVGTVTAGPILSNGARVVAINWVVQLGDGTEIGAVGLENEVPARLLEPRWGETALVVAEASLNGVADLIDRARLVGVRR